LVQRLIVGVLLAVFAASVVVIVSSSGDAAERPHGHGRQGWPAVGKQLFGDVGAAGNVEARWGSVDCADPTRVAFHGKGGDDHPRGDGSGQRAPGYWRLTVQDGDDVAGERCELGRNDHRRGPTALYREGQHRITFVSIRLRPKFPLHRRSWQLVLQMKQAQPSDGGGGTPVLEFDAYDGRWRMGHTGEAIGAPDDTEVWSAPARLNRWVRFAFDIRYSSDPRRGTMRVYADFNGDGDALDRRERSDRIRLATLKREEDGTDEDGYSFGDSLASHLRVGIYHDDGYGCQSSECSMDVDNVGVYEPG
jgi:hypothetical protein